MTQQGMFFAAWLYFACWACVIGGGLAYWATETVLDKRTQRKEIKRDLGGL